MSILDDSVKIQIMFRLRSTLGNFCVVKAGKSLLFWQIYSVYGLVKIRQLKPMVKIRVRVRVWSTDKNVTIIFSKC